MGRSLHISDGSLKKKWPKSCRWPSFHDRFSWSFVKIPPKNVGQQTLERKMFSKRLPLPNDWKGNVGSILFLKSVRKEMDVSKNRGTQNGWFLSWKTLLKLMILGYHYFWKHPNGLPKGLSKWFKLTTVWICEQWAFFRGWNTQLCGGFLHKP